MSDPYRTEESEFHPTADWLPACRNTLANRATDRSDWATIKTFYDQHDLAFRLNEPPVFGTNPGPAVLPLDVTQIREVAPDHPANTLAAPIFSLVQAGARVQPGADARAFLFPAGSDRIVDLGRPAIDQIVARGARPGDRLCVYDLGGGRLGCNERIGPADSQLALEPVAGWQPDVRITPVTSKTVELSVGGLAGDRPPSLRARLYPATGPTPPPVRLDLGPDAVYRERVELDQPAVEGYLHVQVEGSTPLREIVTDYSIGGNPGLKRARNAPRGSPGLKRARNAPAVSADGQVILFADRFDPAAGQFFTIQAATRLPVEPPPGRAVVGTGYWLHVAGGLDLTSVSINIGYQGRDVSTQAEPGLTIYRWHETGWQRLATTVNVAQNEATALLAGPGLYVLMSSVEIPLVGPGWNLVSYPGPEPQPAPDALRSIEGSYELVYSYEAADRDDPWKLYAPDAPEGVSDLAELRPGAGYWISATQTMTWYISSLGKQKASTLSTAVLPSKPPSSFYAVLPAGDSAVADGAAVVAMIDGAICGRSRARLYHGQMVFVVDVNADGDGAARGCGAPGRRVLIQAGTLTFYGTWDDRRLQQLSPPIRITLPAIHR
jgi:hypothetical protein